MFLRAPEILQDDHPTRNFERNVILLGLLVGIVFRLALITLPGSYDGDPNRQDSYQYDSIAWHMVTGYGFSVNRTSTLEFGNCPPCEPVSYPLPGYPLFLAGIYLIFGRNYLLVKLIQVVIDLGTCYLAYRIAKKVSESFRIAALTLFLVALNPFTAVWVTDLSTEILATFFATLTVLAALKSGTATGRPWSLAFGLSAGLGTLVRPGFLFLPIALLSVFWLTPRITWREAALRSALVLAAVATCLFPWVVRNDLVFKRIIFSSKTVSPEQDHVQGYYAWYQNWLLDLTWSHKIHWNYVIYSKWEITDPPFPDYAYDSYAEKQEVEELMKQVREIGRFTPEIDQRFAALAQAKARQHPFRRYITLPVIRIARSWINSGTSGFNDPNLKGSFTLDRIRSHPLAFGVRIFLSLFHSSMLPLGLLGLFALRKRYTLAIPAFLSVAYHTSITEIIGYGIQSRFIVYALPVMFLFIVAGVLFVFDSTFELIKKRIQPIPEFG